MADADCIRVMADRLGLPCHSDLLALRHEAEDNRLIMEPQFVRRSS
jgi:hypothetical protein